LKLDAYIQTIAARSNDIHEQTAPIAKVVSYALSDNREMMGSIMAFPRIAIELI
jgi:hypothetical protein